MSEPNMERPKRRRLRWIAVVAVFLAGVAALFHWGRSSSVLRAIEQVGGKVIWDSREPPNLLHKLVLHDGLYVDLWLVDTEIDDVWLTRYHQQLQRLPDLGLWLRGTSVGDEGLRPLRHAGNIVTLDLSGTRISDAALDDIVTLGELRCLGLAETQVTDAGLERLRELPELWWLSIDGRQATQSGAAAAAECVRRHELRVHDATDQTVVWLAEATPVSRLVVFGSGVTDASIDLLAGMSETSSLYLIDTGITDEGFARLEDARPPRPDGARWIQRMTLHEYMAEREAWVE